MEKQRHTAKSVMELFRQLPERERAELLKMLEEAQGGNEDLETMLMEKRFADGRVCPICGGVHVQHNGRRANGSQKFVCTDYGKTFSIRKNTIFSGTHKSAAVWKEFLPVSYKGDKKAFDGGGCGREPRKRGGGNHRRGLSDELVCLPCAIDRKGKAVSRVAKLGKCSAAAVKAVLGGHVSEKATLCTDGDASYRKFSKDNGNGLVQIKGGKGSVKGIYHIQHLNAYHSRLKAFLASFRGVSTKYLNNYLTWNNVVGARRVELAEKASTLLDLVVSSLFSETSIAIPNRSPLPILVKNQTKIKL